MPIKNINEFGEEENFMTSRRAIISVSDKTGVLEFAQALVDLDFEIVSTGGTYNAIHAAGILQFHY